MTPVMLFKAVSILPPRCQQQKQAWQKRS